MQTCPITSKYSDSRDMLFTVRSICLRLVIDTEEFMWLSFRVQSYFYSYRYFSSSKFLLNKNSNIEVKTIKKIIYKKKLFDKRNRQLAYYNIKKINKLDKKDQIADERFKQNKLIIKTKRERNMSLRNVYFQRFVTHPSPNNSLTMSRFLRLSSDIQRE